jgi:hypothetical protein
VALARFGSRSRGRNVRRRAGGATVARADGVMSSVSGATAPNAGWKCGSDRRLSWNAGIGGRSPSWSVTRACGSTIPRRPLRRIVPQRSTKVDCQSSRSSKPPAATQASAFTATAQGLAAEQLRYQSGPPNQPHWRSGEPRNIGEPTPLASTTRPASTTEPAASRIRPLAKPISGWHVTQAASSATPPSVTDRTRPERNTIARVDASDRATT